MLRRGTHVLETLGFKAYKVVEPEFDPLALVPYTQLYNL